LIQDMLFFIAPPGTIATPELSVARVSLP